MRIVLSLGGSLVNREEGFNVEYIKEIKDILESFEENKYGIVVGGGYEARVVAKGVKARGGNEFEADEEAIKITRKNAKGVAGIFGFENYQVPKYFEDVNVEDRYIFMGGTIPGITTDADAALLAEKTRAKRLINISNVDAIYDKDPREYKDARKYKYMNYEQLIELAVKSDKRTAGTHFIFDMVACKIIQRSKIETHFISGKNLEDLKKAIQGKEHSGTVVKE